MQPPFRDADGASLCPVPNQTELEYLDLSDKPAAEYIRCGDTRLLAREYAAGAVIDYTDDGLRPAGERELLYFLTDPSGVIALSKAAPQDVFGPNDGEIVERYTRDANGRTTIEWSALPQNEQGGSGRSPFGIPRRAGNMLYNETTGLYIDHGGQAYDPNLGTTLSRSSWVASSYDHFLAQWSETMNEYGVTPTGFRAFDKLLLFSAVEDVHANSLLRGLGIGGHLPYRMQQDFDRVWTYVGPTLGIGLGVCLAAASGGVLPAVIALADGLASNALTAIHPALGFAWDMKDCMPSRVGVPNASSAHKNLAQIARETEDRFRNCYHGTCASAAVNNAISAATHGYHWVDIVRVRRLGGKHAIARVWDDAGRPHYLNYGEVSDSVGEITGQYSVGDYIRLQELLGEGPDFLLFEPTVQDLFQWSQKFPGLKPPPP